MTSRKILNKDYMRKYKFNRNEFKWAEEYYNIIQKKMDLPDWFGKNADALWDMLTGYIETPCEIILVGFNKKENDYNERIINLINSCFRDVGVQYPDKFKITVVN